MRSHYLEWFVWAIIVSVVIMYQKSMGHVLFHIYDEIMSIGAHVLKDEPLCSVWNPDDSRAAARSMWEEGREEVAGE